MNTSAPVVADGLTKIFGGPDAEHRVVAVDGVSLRVERGTVTAVVGPSGSGKSTLLQLLAGLDRPDAGTVHIGGEQITGMRDRALTRLRRERLGFVFQSFHLLPQLTAAQNIGLPVRLAGRVPEAEEVADLAALLGIEDRLDHLPSQLSGGQQQRVGIARALITRPEVVFADEPTGALDADTAHELIDLFAHAALEREQTFVVVTHDERLAERADAVWRMSEGRLALERALRPGVLAGP